MARRSRGYLAKCPRFVTVPRTEGGQEDCVAERGGYRFRVVRYRKTGRLVAWTIAKGRQGRHPGGGRIELPVSARSTRSLDQLLDDAVRFVGRVRGRNN